MPTGIRSPTGLAVRSINRLGSLDRDRLPCSAGSGDFLPVGFYYKTFFRPRGAWPLFERLIRTLAGLGTLDPKAQRTWYDKAYLFADVVVVGAGPAGLERGDRRGRSGRRHAAHRRMAGARRLAPVRARRRWSAHAPSALRDDLVAQARSQKNLRILTRNDGHRPLRRQLARRDRRPSASTRSARRRRSSRPAPSISRSCSPTTTGRASCSPTRRSG